MRALLLTDMAVYGVLLVASYFLVFRRRPPRLAPARLVVTEAIHEPAPQTLMAPPSGLQDRPFYIRPWWTLPTSVETSP